MPLDRRDILKYTALLTGYAVSAPIATALLSGCDLSPEPETATKPGAQADLKFFTAANFPYVQIFADTLLPATDSPSATEVGVEKVLDRMLGEVFDEAYRQTMLANWAALMQQLKAADFRTLSQQDREQLLLPLRDSASPAGEAYRELRQQIIVYYLTSEEIGENFLNYLPIPGEYKPCISIDDVNNKAWAII